MANSDNTYFFKDSNIQPDFLIPLDNKDAGINLVEDTRSELSFWGETYKFTQLATNNFFNSLEYSHAYLYVEMANTLGGQTDLTLSFLVGSTYNKSKPIYMQFQIMEYDGDDELQLKVTEIPNDTENIRTLRFRGDFFENIEVDIDMNIKINHLCVVLKKLENVKVYLNGELEAQKDLDDNALENNTYNIQTQYEYDWNDERLTKLLTNKDATIRRYLIVKQALTDDEVVELYKQEVLLRRTCLKVFNNLRFFASCYSNSAPEYRHTDNGVRYGADRHDLDLRANEMMYFYVGDYELESYHNKLILSADFYFKNHIVNDIYFFNIDTQNYIKLGFSNDEVLQYDTNFDLETWYRISAVYTLNENKVELYINGNLVDTLTYSGNRSTPKVYNNDLDLPDNTVYVKNIVYLTPYDNYSVDKFFNIMSWFGTPIDNENFGNSYTETKAYANAKRVRIIKAKTNDINININAENLGYKVVLLVSENNSKPITINTNALARGRKVGIKTSVIKEPIVTLIDNLLIADNNYIRTNYFLDRGIIIEKALYNQYAQVVYQNIEVNTKIELYGKMIDKQIADKLRDSLNFNIIVKFNNNITFDIFVEYVEAKQVAEGIPYYDIKLIGIIERII